MKHDDVVLRLALHEKCKGSHTKAACGTPPPAKFQYLSLCFRNKFQQRSLSHNSNEWNRRVRFAKSRLIMQACALRRIRGRSQSWFLTLRHDIWPPAFPLFIILSIENVPLFSGLIKSYCHPESQLQLRVFQSQESIVF